MKTAKYPQIMRDKVLQLVAKNQMQNLSLAEIEDYVEESLTNKNNTEIEAILLASIKYFYRGYTNGFLSDMYHVLTNKSVEVIGDVEQFYICDCCGYYSLDEKIGIEGGWDICQYCKWQDTSIGADDITQHCGCNHGSIQEYRQHMLDNLNIYYREKWFRSK